MTRKPSKVAAAKTFFSSVYVVDATCLDECFLFHVVTGRYYFFEKKFVVTLRFSEPPYCCFVCKCYERSPYFDNNVEVLIPKFKNKAAMVY